MNGRMRYSISIELYCSLYNHIGEWRTDSESLSGCFTESSDPDICETFLGCRKPSNLTPVNHSPNHSRCEASVRSCVFYRDKLCTCWQNKFRNVDCVKEFDFPSRISCNQTSPRSRQPIAPFNKGSMGSRLVIDSSLVFPCKRFWRLPPSGGRALYALTVFYHSLQKLKRV